jgi:hypothetical protein
MYRFDETGWPMVKIRSEGPTSLDDVQDYFSRWEEWLAREERMGVMVIQLDQEQQKPGKEVHKFSNGWHKENRERVGRYCAGFAGVMGSSKWLALYKPIAGRVAKKKFGCPGQVFATEGEAEAWLTELLKKPSAHR